MTALSPQTEGERLLFPRECLEALAGQLRDRYAGAGPFPHVVIDDFFPAAAAQRIIDEFPPLDGVHWHGSGMRNPQRRLKHMSRGEEAFTPFIRSVLYQLNAGPFIRFVESVTGIAPLLPDPDIGHTLRHFERGGCLGVHTDFNWHTRLELHRRVNLIVYLNRDWRDEYGGHLELWDEAMTRCVRRIAPVANRAVLFATNDRTPHGFPDPLTCPHGETRRTIQMYYYSSRIPESERVAPHRTLFRSRPGEGGEAPPARARNIKALLADLVPPALYRVLQRQYRKTKT